MNKVMTSKEVCEAFGISIKTLYRWRKTHGFPGSMTGYGARPKFSANDITKWVERNVQELEPAREKPMAKGSTE